MANDLNKVVLIGRLTKDAETRIISNGTTVTNFSLANNKSYTKDGNKQEQVSFFDCLAWGKLGEIIAQYCKKGKQIGVEGRLQQNSWEDKDGNRRHKVEIVVENFQFLSPSEGTKSYVAPDTQVGDNPFSDDSIPF